MLNWPADRDQAFKIDQVCLLLRIVERQVSQFAYLARNSGEGSRVGLQVVFVAGEQEAAVSRFRLLDKVHQLGNFSLDFKRVDHPVAGLLLLGHDPGQRNNHGQKQQPHGFRRVPLQQLLDGLN